MTLRKPTAAPRKARTDATPTPSTLNLLCSDLISPLSSANVSDPEALVQAEREIRDGAPWSAVVTFERILAVCEAHGLEIPAEFWFRQAGVPQGAGLHERAVEASTRYLRRGSDPPACLPVPLGRRAVARGLRDGHA